jgi:hypothetical protein
MAADTTTSILGSVAKQPPHLAIYGGASGIASAFGHHHIGHRLDHLCEEVNGHVQRIAESGSVACDECSVADPVDRLQAVC